MNNGPYKLWSVLIRKKENNNVVPHEGIFAWVVLQFIVPADEYLLKIFLS